MKLNLSNSSILRLGLYCFFIAVGVGDIFRGEVVNSVFVLFLFIVVLLLLFLLKRITFWMFFCFSLFFIVGIFRVFVATTGPDFSDLSFFNDFNNKVTVLGIIKKQPEIKNNAQYIVLSANSLIYGDEEFFLKGDVLIKMDIFPSYYYGDKLNVYGNLLTPADFETFSYSDYLAKDNIFSVMYRPYVVKINSDEKSFFDYFDFFGVMFSFRDLIKERIEYYLSEPHAGIALGLLIGARASISQVILDNFQKTGLTHILAISGYNITLIINVFAMVMRGAGRRPRFWITSMMIAMFAIITDLSASVVRASVMGIFTILANYVGRKGSGFQMLLFSGFLMVLVNPLILLRDVSFQLSFLSTVGLLLLLPLIEKYFKKLPPLISESLAVTLAATVFTTPIVLLNFERFSIISPLANVVFLPLIPMIMFTSFLSFFSSFVFSPLAFLFAFVSWFLIELLLFGVSFVSEIPFAMIEVPGFNEICFFIYYILLFIIIKIYTKAKPNNYFL